jgi:nucleoside-diphosphate-sugar epimerase
MNEKDLVKKWSKLGIFDETSTETSNMTIPIESQSKQLLTDKIDVFGSTGFIGSKFCELYPDESVKVPRECNVPTSKQILYLISTTDNYNVFSDLHVDINTNLNKLMDVLENCKGKDVTINFVSSWFVYGDTPLPAREDSKCNPTGFYSITKKCAEDLLISYCKTFGLKYRILRLGNVFGPTDKGVSAKKNALQHLINEIKAERDVNLYFNGYFYRDYIYVDDVCRAIKLCIDKSECDTIINVSNGKAVEFRALIDNVIRLTKSKSKINAVEQPPFHKLVQTKNMILNTNKLKSLGYKPSIDIESDIKLLVT